jgi:DNA-binding NarL/FixJ family response regulator
MTPDLLIVDDNLQFLAVARRLLEGEGMKVVGVASTSADALRYANELRPDVTLVDVDLGQESGFDLAQQLKEAAGAAGRRVILISAYSAQDLAELVESSPAVGFLPKSQLSAKAIIELVGWTDGDKAVD